MCRSMWEAPWGQSLWRSIGRPGAGFLWCDGWRCGPSSARMPKVQETSLDAPDDQAAAASHHCGRGEQVAVVGLRGLAPQAEEGGASGRAGVHAAVGAERPEAASSRASPPERRRTYRHNNQGYALRHVRVCVCVATPTCYMASPRLPRPPPKTFQGVPGPDDTCHGLTRLATAFPNLPRQ